MQRCDWAGPEQIYLDYHDTDWGVPEYDSRALWEKLILDGFQAGLSWITILKKRENFREAFAGFDPNVIATWGEAEVSSRLSTFSLACAPNETISRLLAINAVMKEWDVLLRIIKLSLRSNLLPLGRVHSLNQQ